MLDVLDVLAGMLAGLLVGALVAWRRAVTPATPRGPLAVERAPPQEATAVVDEISSTVEVPVRVDAVLVHGEAHPACVACGAPSSCAAADGTIPFCNLHGRRVLYGGWRRLPFPRPRGETSRSSLTESDNAPARGRR